MSRARAPIGKRWRLASALSPPVLTWTFAVPPLGALAVLMRHDGLGWVAAMGAAFAGLGVQIKSVVDRRRRHRGLDATTRAQLRAVYRTGRPSGDTKVDRRALSWLEHEMQRRPELEWFTALDLLVTYALPVVAATQGSRWWLLCLVALPVQAASIWLWQRDAQRRHDDLQAALPADVPPPWWHYRPAPRTTTTA